jgi:hypothetical protein
VLAAHIPAGDQSVKHDRKEHPGEPFALFPARVGRRGVELPELREVPRREHAKDPSVPQRTFGRCAHGAAVPSGDQARVYHVPKPAAPIAHGVDHLSGDPKHPRGHFLELFLYI